VGKAFAAALLAAAMAVSAAAQDLIGARGFVANLYVRKTNDRYFNAFSPRILTADLYALVQDGKGALDNDPLCQCRSNDGLSAQIVSVSGNNDRAIVRVLLRFDADRVAPPQRVALVLTRIPLAGWKIADIQSARIPSLKAWLARRQAGAGRAAGIARAR
jgi:hypothetical protein